MVCKVDVGSPGAAVKSISGRVAQDEGMGRKVAGDLDFENPGTLAMNDPYPEVTCPERRMEKFIDLWQRLDDGQGVKIEAGHRLRKAGIAG